MCASHSGEDKHVRTLQALLRRASVSQALLRCGTEGAPADARTAARLVRDGETPGAIRHSCSGFHAASLLLCRPRRLVARRLRRPCPSQPGRRPRDGRAALRPAPGHAPHEPRQLRAADVRDAPRRGRARVSPAGRPGGGRAGRAPVPIGPGAAAHPRRHDGGPGHGRRHLRNLDTELMRRRPGRLVSKAGADGLRAVGLLAGSGERCHPGERPGHQDRGRRPLAPRHQGRQRGGAGAAGRPRRARPARPGAVPPPHRPDARRARCGHGLPRFELAPLGELA